MIFSGIWKVLRTGPGESDLTCSGATEEGPINEADGAGFFTVVDGGGSVTEKLGVWYSGGAA